MSKKVSSNLISEEEKDHMVEEATSTSSQENTKEQERENAKEQDHHLYHQKSKAD